MESVRFEEQRKEESAESSFIFLNTVVGSFSAATRSEIRVS